MKFLDENKFPEEKKETYKRHRHINISLKDSACLYLYNSIPCCFRKENCWEKKEKLKKLFDIGAGRIETELNVVRLMRNMRN